MRDVVLGKNSKVWRLLVDSGALDKDMFTAISHAEIADFSFRSDDRVWVFSYSRNPDDNRRLIRHLSDCGAAEIIYLSSSSAIISDVTKCYEYPRVKRLAATECLALPQGRVLTIGQIYADPAELPGGDSAATSLRDLGAHMTQAAQLSQVPKSLNLFRMIRREFAHRGESWLYLVYDYLQRLAGRFPCLLRPLDLLLRLAGARWYGYVRMSNRLWAAREQ